LRKTVNPVVRVQVSVTERKKDPLTPSLHLMTINDNKYSFLIHLNYILQNSLICVSHDQVMVNQNVRLSLEQIKNRTKIVAMKICRITIPQINFYRIHNSSNHHSLNQKMTIFTKCMICQITKPIIANLTYLNLLDLTLCGLSSRPNPVGLSFEAEGVSPTFWACRIKSKNHLMKRCFR